MDHVVYLDSKANELINLLDGSKSMIIRGATGRKLPYGRVDEGDVLFFVNNDAEGQVKAKGVVSSVFNSAMMSEEESVALVTNYQERLKLTDRQFSRWAGKRYIVLIGVKDVKEIEPFAIDKSNFGNLPLRMSRRRSMSGIPKVTPPQANSASPLQDHWSMLPAESSRTTRPRSFGWTTTGRLNRLPP